MDENENNELLMQAGDWFADAGIDINDIPDDPFNFGNSHWPLFVEECRPPKVSEKTGRVGMFMYFKMVHPKYENVQRFGKWIEIPPPKAVQDAYGYTFDPKGNPDHAMVAKNFIDFLKSIGFGMDEIRAGMASPAAIGNKERFFTARLRKPKLGEFGFYQHDWYDPKPFDSADPNLEGLNEFAAPTSVVDEAAAALAGSSDE